MVSALSVCCDYSEGGPSPGEVWGRPGQASQLRVRFSPSLGPLPGGKGTGKPGKLHLLSTPVCWVRLGDTPLIFRENVDFPGLSLRVRLSQGTLGSSQREAPEG